MRLIEGVFLDSDGNVIPDLNPEARSALIVNHFDEVIEADPI